MPGSVRKDDKAKRIALDILGPSPVGLTDSFGNKKKFRRKKEKDGKNNNFQEEKINRFEEIGFR